MLAWCGGARWTEFFGLVDGSVCGGMWQISVFFNKCISISYSEEVQDLARFHGDLVRIEVGREEREKLFDGSKLDDLHKLAKTAGFKYVAIDAFGYRTGAMDEVLES